MAIVSWRGLDSVVQPLMYQAHASRRDNRDETWENRGSQGAVSRFGSTMSDPHNPGWTWSGVRVVLSIMSANRINQTKKA